MNYATCSVCLTSLCTGSIRLSAAFDKLVEHSSSAENWGQIRKELNERGVRLTMNIEANSCSVHTVNVVT